MILRSRHGLVDGKVGDDFERYFARAVVDELPHLKGNLGVFTRRVTQGGFDHFFLLSYWEDWGAVQSFAGDAPHLAVGYPDDQRFNLVGDPIVLHVACTEIRPWFGEPAHQT